MEIIKLIGVLIVVIGLLLKFDTLATVVVAGIVTGLVSGMSLIEILDVLGSSFLSQRLATLFVLTLPAIGISERYGLKDKAVDFINKLKNVTVGRIISLYLVIRAMASAFSLRLGGHPQFVRPLINPMAQGSAVSKYGELNVEDQDDIKGLSAAAENFGNFFAQNCFMGSSGTLLIVSTLTEQGIDVDALGVASWSIPIAVASILLGASYFILYDRKLKSKYDKKEVNNG